MNFALIEVARIIQRESGIVLSAAQLPSLEAAIARVDPNLTAEGLLSEKVSSETIERLIDEITIRETFFFRHPSELDAIDWPCMLRSARARGSELIRVWVAGCASGEEAYTIAILASEAFASASPPVRVLATDIAPTALEQAIAGRYGERAVRTLPGGVRERYFSTAGAVSTVGERLRGLVEFRRHNLVRDPMPPAGEQRFDVILCRNVLIYFDRPTVEHVLERLEGALAPAGLLLLGAADRLSGQSLPAARGRPGGVATRLSSARKLRRGVLRGPSGRDQAGVKRPHSTPARPPQQASREHGPREQPLAEQTSTHSRPTSGDAMKAADGGELDLAVQIAQDVLEEDPLDSQAHYIRGVAELARQDARAALEPLRRALYIDPNFSLAAFKLACAHDALGELGPARRTYERTQRTLDHCATEQRTRSDQLDLLDIAAACHTRLKALKG
jgi:chemotaxis protein methyltransferase CheR